MIEICAYCVYELDSVNLAIRGKYLDYDGESWIDIPEGKVIDIVVAEGRRVRTATALELHPESNLVQFKGTLLCTHHFKHAFKLALVNGEVQ